MFAPLKKDKGNSKDDVMAGVLKTKLKQNLTWNKPSTEHWCKSEGGTSGICMG